MNPLSDPLVLWSHALAALAFTLLTLWAMRRDELPVPRRTFAIAAGCTALWALAVAGIGPGELVVRIAQAGRDLSWLAFLWMVLRRGPSTPERWALGVVHVVLIGVIAASVVLATTIAVVDAGPVKESMNSAWLVLRVMTLLGGLVLVHNLHFSSNGVAAGRRMLVTLALAVMWMADASMSATALFVHPFPPTLIAMRGFLASLLAPLLAVGLARGRDWTVQVSRTITFQSLGLLGLAGYVLLMTFVTSVLDGLGGDKARLAQTAFAVGTTAAFLTIAFNPAFKAWMKVQVAKHFFAHRYDYRAEWLRFTDTLGRAGEDAAPQGERIVKAVADLTDSPAGLLLVADGAGLGLASHWNWPVHDLPAHAGDAELAAHLLATGRILELDAIRGEWADPSDATSAPQWMLDQPGAWAVVPLLHFGDLAGAILLARPPVDRALDWEDFDLLKIAGRQVASYLAEARAQGQLADSQRFQEFNRRFAFIVHDIKNLVSQLTLVARNAERHADNPEFRADMVATLQDSAGRMSDLLARLSQRHAGQVARRAVGVLPLVERLASRRRGQHPVVTGGDASALAEADPMGLEQLIGHLLQNAIDASPASQPVTIEVATHEDEILIDVTDQGCGMSQAFIRDRLFKPFDSDKSGGFGIGAFEARQLAHAMHGRIEVSSRKNEGSRFRVILPLAKGQALLEAAA